MRIQRKKGLPDYFRIESNKNIFDNIRIELPDKRKIIEISYDSAENSGHFSLEQIVEIRNTLTEILKESGIE